MEDYEREYVERRPKCKTAWEEAKQVIPMGVGSNVRAWSPLPIFVKKAQGTKVWDIDGNEYIDFQLAMGPLIGGHAHPKLVEAVKAQIEDGTMYAMPHEKTFLAIREIQKRFPCMEMVRFTNSGTEATMHAIRAARAHTGKDRIIKLEGGYHGPHDYALWSFMHPKGTMGPARLPSSVPRSTGIPKCIEGTTLVVPYNDIEAFEYVVRKYEGEIACFILEPVMGNSSTILPKNGYLKQVREITERENIVLIFDEVITGCRVAYGGATEYYKIEPDMITLSKAIGGGYPIGAFGGRKDIMTGIEQNVAHYGTYNASPLVITACLVTLRDIATPEATKELNSKSDSVFKTMQDIITKTRVAAQMQHVGSMGGLLFTDKKVVDGRTAMTADPATWHRFFFTMLNKGIIMLGGHYLETIFLSVAHTDEDYDRMLNAFEETLETLQKSR